ncbi:aminotransferase [Pelistega indica]|uniref:Aminotransferase n=1 Tax=Pelistega indica TaxID=1414851 RepID=V8G8C8_9BURK|nr:methionine aminotransferase [Pelistega indica]ETD72208.1 aminotransferase [Pelistega indica]
MSIQVQSKMPSVGTTIFTVMADLLKQYPDVIGLSQGAPNFMLAPEMMDSVYKAMQAGHNQYAPMIGIEPLRQRMVEKIEHLYGHRYDVDNEITIMPSASEAIYSSIASLVHSGDEIICFEPGFDSYIPIIQLQGAIPVIVELKAPKFDIDWDQVKSLISPKTRMIILNSPHNPTGRILTESDIDALMVLTENTNIIILSDEVYEHMVFDEEPHRSMSRYPSLAARSIVVTSFGKTYQVTGWRVGCCVAPAELMEQIRLVHQFLMFSANTPIQYALAEVLERPDLYLKLGEFFERKRDILIQGIEGSRFEVIPSKGGFFQLLKFDHFMPCSDMDMVKYLITEVGVGAIPVGAFYSQPRDTGLIRLTFARDDETLRIGAERLKNA